MKREKRDAKTFTIVTNKRFVSIRLSSPDTIVHMDYTESEIEFYA